VNHGDRLEILQTRRKFLRVRTPAGVEGWTDERQTPRRADMASLRDLSARGREMPSQGVATPYSPPLNVHMQPVATSPSFVQLQRTKRSMSCVPSSSRATTPRPEPR